MINRITQRIQNNNVIFNNNNNMTPLYSSEFRMNTLKADSVTFMGRPRLTSEQKMTRYARQFLKEIGLKPNKPLCITAESKYVPFLRILTEEAYKKDSGNVIVKVVEPELEALEKKYKITESFESSKQAKQELVNEGAIFVKFAAKNCPYKKAGLSKLAIMSQVKRITPQIPEQVSQIMELDPVEIFKTVMDLREGQTVIINGKREHLPRIVKLVEYLYSQNKSRIVKVNLTEKPEFDRNIPFYNHAKDDLIGQVKPSTISYAKEILDNCIARLSLAGGNPKQYSGVDTKKMTQHAKAASKATEVYSSLMTTNTPWLIYYLPTTESAVFSYPEYGAKKLQALAHALKDAKEINRVGKLEEHIKNLVHMSEKVNELLDKGYRTIRFVSVDSAIQRPDGKTNLAVGLSPKSFFTASKMTTPSGQTFIANIPTEEVFSSPQANLTTGKVSSTMPLVLNGNIVEGIEMTFAEGKAININASQNLEMLQNHIKAHENADMLGEVALVAGSPIAMLKRIFFSTLLDENAACHIALGKPYAKTIKGALEIQDFAERQKYLKDNHINYSTTHNDFMIGGPNVQVFAENAEGDKILLIKDDKFQL